MTDSIKSVIEIRSPVESLVYSTFMFSLFALSFLKARSSFPSLTNALITAIPAKLSCEKSTLFPFDGHISTGYKTAGEQTGKRNERKTGEQRVHTSHLHKGKSAEENGITEHKYSRAEAVLNRFKIVGEKAHQSSDLVHLIIFLRKILAVIEHTAAQIGFNLDARAEEADSPKEAPDDHTNDYPNERQADPVEQEGHIEGKKSTVHLDRAVVHSVYDHSVKLGYEQLNVVHQNERQGAQQKRGKRV